MSEQAKIRKNFPVKLLCLLITANYASPIFAETYDASYTTDDGFPFIRITSHYPKPQTDYNGITEVGTDTTVSSPPTDDSALRSDMPNGIVITPRTNLASPQQAVAAGNSTDTPTFARINTAPDNENIHYLVDPTHQTVSTPPNNTVWPFISVAPKAVIPSAEAAVAEHTESSPTIYPNVENPKISAISAKKAAKKNVIKLPSIQDAGGHQSAQAAVAEHAENSPTIYPNIENPKISAISAKKVAKKNVIKLPSIQDVGGQTTETFETKDLNNERFRLSPSNPNIPVFHAETNTTTPAIPPAKDASVNPKTLKPFTSGSTSLPEKNATVVIYPNVEKPNKFTSRSLPSKTDVSSPKKTTALTTTNDTVQPSVTPLVPAERFTVSTENTSLDSVNVNSALKAINTPQTTTSSPAAAPSDTPTKPQPKAKKAKNITADQKRALKNRQRGLPIHIYPNVEKPQDSVESTDGTAVDGKSTETNHASTSGKTQFYGSVGGELIGYRGRDLSPSAIDDRKTARVDVAVVANPNFSYVSADQKQKFDLSLYGSYNKRASANSPKTDDIWLRMDVREAMFTQKLKNGVLKAGIGKVFWGVTESQHLVDIINQTDYSAGLVSSAKLGQPMINLSWTKYLDKAGALDAFVLPYFRTREYGDALSYLHTDQTALGSSNAAFESVRGRHNIDYALRWTKQFGVVDMGLSYFKGTARDPLFTSYSALSANPGVYQSTAPTPYYYGQINQLGLDVQASFSGWLLKLEALKRAGTLTFDPIANTVAHDAYTALDTGFEYTVSGLWGTTIDLGLLAEYNHDSRGTKASSLFQHDAFYGTRWALNNVQGTEIKAGIVQDLDYKTKSLTLDMSSRINDQLKIRAEGLYFIDLDAMDKLSMQFKDNEYIKLGLDYYF